MNYHFMIDDKFIDNFISISEKISPKKNKYIYLFSPPGVHVRSSNGVFAPYRSKKLNEILKKIEVNDRVYIHWFEEKTISIIKKIPGRTKIYLFFWGGDFIEQTKNFFDFNYDNLTKKYLKYNKKNFQIYKHLTNYRFFKMIYFCLKNKKIPSYTNYEFIIRKLFLKRINYFCHWNKFDYKLVCKEYGCRPLFLDFFYSTDIEKITSDYKKNNTTKIIWLGNSDTETNNHLDAMNVLSKFKKEKIKIICPLSYGNIEYGNYIDQIGKNLFGYKWESIRNFTNKEIYFNKLKKADILVMYHNRTQGAGNIFTAIKMGKKVFIKKKSTIYKLMKKQGIKIYNSSSIKKMSLYNFLKPLTTQQKETNIKKISKLFSKEKELLNLDKILN